MIFQCCYQSEKGGKGLSSLPVTCPQHLSPYTSELLVLKLTDWFPVPRIKFGFVLKTFGFKTLSIDYRNR